MLRGKHIVIVISILLLLLINYGAYNAISSANDAEIGASGNWTGPAIFFIFIEAIAGVFTIFSVLACNWNNIWNWEFNLNKWICKLKH